MTGRFFCAVEKVANTWNWVELARMGRVQDRKKRQLAEREQIFLDRAWSMIQSDGLLNLQMAKLANECEYSVGTLYQHFSAKEDLLVALATRSVGDRLELYRRAAEWQGPTRHRMLAILLADILFAQKEPEYFRLAQYVSTHTVWMSASEERREAALEASFPLAEAVASVVSEGVSCGDVHHHGMTERELCSGLWSMSEGMHMLVSAAGLLEAHSVPRPYQLLVTNTHALLNGLGWQPIQPLDDAEQHNAMLEQIMIEVFPDFSMATCPVVFSTDSE